MFWWRLFGPQGTAFRKNEVWGSCFRGLVFGIPITVITIFLLSLIMM